MNIEFVYEQYEVGTNKRPFMVADAIRRALTYGDYKKVIFLCYADITSDDRVIGSRRKIK
jgi:hypothetical protein